VVRYYLASRYSQRDLISLYPDKVIHHTHRYMPNNNLTKVHYMSFF